VVAARSARERSARASQRSARAAPRRAWPSPPTRSRSRSAHRTASARDRAQNPASTSPRPRPARSTKSSSHPFARATDDQQARGHGARCRFEPRAGDLAVVRRQLRDGRAAAARKRRRESCAFAWAERFRSRSRSAPPCHPTRHSGPAGARLPVLPRCGSAAEGLRPTASPSRNRQRAGGLETGKIPNVPRAVGRWPQRSAKGVAHGSAVPLEETDVAREPQAWGGEVRLPGWLRRLLRRGPAAADTAEAAHEARKAQQAGDYDSFEHMQAAGTLEPHHAELPGGKLSRPRSRR
jgi:hypothetical protein